MRICNHRHSFAWIWCSVAFYLPEWSGIPSWEIHMRSGPNPVVLITEKMSRRGVGGYSKIVLMVVWLSFVLLLCFISLIDFFHVLNHSHIPGINPTWSNLLLNSDCWSCAHLLYIVPILVHVLLKQEVPAHFFAFKQGPGSLVGCHLWGHPESDTTEVT